MHIQYAVAIMSLSNHLINNRMVRNISEDISISDTDGYKMCEWYQYWSWSKSFLLFFYNIKDHSCYLLFTVIWSCCNFVYESWCPLWLLFYHWLVFSVCVLDFIYNNRSLHCKNVSAGFFSWLWQQFTTKGWFCLSLSRGILCIWMRGLIDISAVEALIF